MRRIKENHERFRFSLIEKRSRAWAARSNNSFLSPLKSSVASPRVIYRPLVDR